MAPTKTALRRSVSIDALAAHSFVQEMTEAVENVAIACISGPNGEELWSQCYSNGPFRPDDCIPSGSTQLLEPARRELGKHHTAYSFPLPCENLSGVAFTLVIYSSDPPSLASVVYGIESMVTCLARQLDVDSILETSRLAVSPTKPKASFEKRLSELTAEGSVEQCLGELADMCLTEFSAIGVAIALPGEKLRVVKTGSEITEQAVNNLLARLYKPLKAKGKLLSARISLRDGADGHVVCAPVLREQREVHGLVIIASNAADAVYSNIARAIATRIAVLPIDEPTASRPLTRFELTSQVDDILQRQPTLPHSLIYFDVDKVHTINDAFGYTGGDRAISIVRRIIASGAGVRDLFAHLGSDRFALFLPGASGDTAEAKAAQILRLLSEESIDDGDKSINLTASAGVVDNTAAPKGAEDLLILSEVAARGAQDRGGNQAALFQDVDSSIIQRRSDVDKVGFLQMALIENQFVLHAQRIQALGENDGEKFELLARLKCDGAPDRSPAEFLSAAERYQLMAALDRWVINSALDTMAASDNPLEVSLSTFSINVSAQSLQDKKLVDFIESRISETGVPPDSLCFELTETSLVRNIERAQRFVHRMQRLGCQVALDDFGTGYSSFAYLKALPVNYLKVDGAFVRDILDSELSKTIVSSVVAIAQVIGAETVAEHVENQMVEAWLRNAGVNYAQGFAIHKPEPFSNVLSSLGGITDFLGSTSCLDLRELQEQESNAG